MEGGPHEPGRQVEATDSLGEVPWPGACPPAPRLAPFPEINMPLLYVRAWHSLQGVRRPRRWEWPRGSISEACPSPDSQDALLLPKPRGAQPLLCSWAFPPRGTAAGDPRPLLVATLPTPVSPASGPVPVSRALHTCQVPSREAALRALIRGANSVCSRTQQRPPPASPRKRGSSGRLALPPASGLEEGPPGTGQWVGSGRIRLGNLGAGLVGHSV